MGSILALLPMFFKQIGSSEKSYLVPLGVVFLGKELARIGLAWTPEKVSSYVGDSCDLFIAEELAAANLLIAKSQNKPA